MQPHTEYQHVKSKRVPHISTDQKTPRLTFKELLFELNTLKKHQHSPKVDLKETNGKFFASIELPGVKPDDMKIYVRDSKFLIVSNNKYNRDYTEDVTNIYTESTYGHFTRRIKVSSLIHNKFDTSYENGVLYVTLYKLSSQTTQQKHDKLLDKKTQEKSREGPSITSKIVKAVQSERVVVSEKTNEKTDDTIDFNKLDNGNWGDDI